MNKSNSSIVGPIHAEEITDDEDLLLNYVSMNGAESIYEDNIINSIIAGDKIILSGVRGTGKTMTMKTGEILLNKKFFLKTDDSPGILPCFVSFSGFKKDVNLQDEHELKDKELGIAREVFRGYFYMTLLYSILEQIEKFNLDKEIPFNFFGVKTKFGIKRKIQHALLTFKQLGFKELIQAKKIGSKIGSIFPGINTNFNLESGKEDTSKIISLDDIQKTTLFKLTLESICQTYNLKKIHFLFDEVYYLKYLQSEFFDILFGFRNIPYSSFSLSAYPTLMDYGNEFDIPDDSKLMSVTSLLYKPNKDKFEKPISDFISRRIEYFGKVAKDKIISENGLEHLILYTNGNPRILLQCISHLWDNSKITINSSSLTNDIVNYITKYFYIDFLTKQAKRARISLDKINSFLKVIIERLKDHNQKNEDGTIFFLLDNEIVLNFSKTIDLLQYCRIIDEYKIGDFGGSSGKKGTIYLINPFYGRYFGIFTRLQISNLPDIILKSINKDRKIQFSKLNSFKPDESELINSCPIYIENKCEDIRCGNSYNESWKICPFHMINLDVEHQFSDEEISINNLEVISEKIKERLRINNIFTILQIREQGIEGLKKIQYIGNKRAHSIYFFACEYIDDNL